MKTTTNFGLKKPDGTDFFNVADQNDNMDKIDSALQGFKDGSTKAGNADKLDGNDSTYFATVASVKNIVDGTTKVGNADKLDGKDSSYFATSENITNIVKGNTKVGDSDKLDGKDSSYFAPASNVYSKTETDNKIQDAIDGLETGETPIGNASSLGGHRADYFATAESVTKLTNGTTPAGKATDAAQLGGETALQWQGKIDSIQTTSKAALSQAGWYRVAEYASTSTGQANGNNANSCIISLKRTVRSNTDNESCRVQLISKRGRQSFSVLYSNSGTQMFTRLRYTVKSNTAYIEMYYNGADDGIAVFVELSNQPDYYTKWKAITPTLTEETVDGVTVTTTYDIPANASPVTNLDLQQVTAASGGYLTTSILEKALEVASGVYNFKLGGADYTGEDLPNTTYAYGIATIYKRSTSIISVVLWGRQGKNASKIQINHCYNSTWDGWEEVTTTADLANYFKNTGGTIDGHVIVRGADSIIQMSLRNNTRLIQQEITASGIYQLYDVTNSKAIVRSTTDGTNTFNGTATGNLPLTGGTLTGSLTLKTDNISSRARTCSFYNADDTNYGALGAYSENGVIKYMYLGTTYERSKNLSVTADDLMWKNNDVHHDGNSAKVAIQSTAPTDGLWVW